MISDRTSRIIAVVATAVIALLVFLGLSVTYLSVMAKDTNTERGEIVLLDDEFIELFEQPTTTSTIGEQDAASYMEEPQHNASQPASAAGTDLEDAGNVGEPTPILTSKERSPVKQTPDKPKASGAAADNKKKEQDEIKRQATNEVANAFRNSTGRHNSQTSNTADNGPSGNRTQNPNSQGTTGTGTGSVGGGWIIPKYAAVPSTVTGSIKMVVKIDNTGRVTSVSFNGGQPPAATDAAVRAAVEREIRSHKFSRSNYNDAEGATAYITYTFK